MATKVYITEEIELQDGQKVTIKPLNIKALRKFMEVVKDFDKIEDEDESISLMVRACAIAIAPSNKALSENEDLLEEALDVPTMWRILEIAGGVKPNDPNLAAMV